MFSKTMKNYLLLIFTAVMFGAGSQAESLIVEAAKAADWTRLESLLSEGADVNSRYGDGTSALHWASYKDNLEIVALLIDAGADVNATTDIGVTPLWLAAENASADMVRTLLNAGAESNTSLLSGESAVMVAALSGSADVVELLLTAGADPNISVTRGQTALMWAAGRGHAAVVATLLAHGANVELRTEIQTLPMKTDKEQWSHPDYRGMFSTGGHTALMFAARSGDLDSAVSLVEAGSNINQISASGESSLTMAVHGGNAEIVDFLARNGADLDLSDAGYTALHAAVLRGNHQAVEVLLVHGADANAKITKATPTRRQSLDFHFHQTFVGATPLWLAARLMEPAMMKSLLEYGADPHFVHNVRYPAGGDGDPLIIMDEGQVSVLMAAVGMGNRRLDRVSPMGRSERDFLDKSAIESLVLEAVMLALDAGVDPMLEDASNRTALDTATSLGYASVIAVLEESGSG